MDDTTRLGWACEAPPPHWWAGMSCRTCSPPQLPCLARSAAPRHDE